MFEASPSTSRSMTRALREPLRQSRRRLIAGASASRSVAAKRLRRLREENRLARQRRPDDAPSPVSPCRAPAAREPPPLRRRRNRPSDQRRWRTAGPRRESITSARSPIARNAFATNPAAARARHDPQRLRRPRRYAGGSPAGPPAGQRRHRQPAGGQRGDAPLEDARPPISRNCLGAGLRGAGRARRPR